MPGRGRLEQVREEARLLWEEPAHRVNWRGRLLAPWWRRRFHSFGDHAVLDWPSWLYGPHMISIGPRALILRGAWLSVEQGLWKQGEPALVIGEAAWIGAGVRISVSAGVVIEPHVVIAGSCSIMDSDHTHGPASAHAQGRRENVLFNPQRAAPIRIGRGTWLGDRVTVTRGADIGRHCTIGAHSVVRGAIPDYSVAVGVPARVVGSTREEG
jgi:lipopolysaccharide O-acetyltransferase